MRRNMDLIRRILEFLEGCDHEHRPRRDGFMPASDDIPYCDIEVSYHIRLCREAGLVRMTDRTAQLKELTWAGHEMLDQLRQTG